MAPFRFLQYSKSCSAACTLQPYLHVTLHSVCAKVWHDRKTANLLRAVCTVSNLPRLALLCKKNLCFIIQHVATNELTLAMKLLAAEIYNKLRQNMQVWAFTLLGEHVQGAAFAEYVRVPAAMLGKVPPSVTMEAASTVGLGTLTAAMGTYKCLELPTTAAEPGKTPVLVYGASSATGVFAVSLLKNSGYRVVAVASKKNHKWLQDTVGAAQCVDYKDANWVDQIAADSANKGLKYAVDCIGNAATGMHAPHALDFPETAVICGCSQTKSYSSFFVVEDKIINKEPSELCAGMCR